MDDATAVARVKAGEKDAFRLLTERHSHALFRLAFRLMENEAEAEEVVQDTFLRAYQGLARFEERSNFGTWVYRIAINRCYDLLASRKARPQPLDPDPDDPSPEEHILSGRPGPERVLLSQEIKLRLGSAMKQLTAREHTAFVLRHFEGRSIEEIARLMNMRQGAAKNTVHRAVQRLRHQLLPLRQSR
ncbi:MAG TPA: sigma-70 family RNA polymerase sigma factor [Terriglobales bacterium]